MYIPLDKTLEDLLKKEDFLKLNQNWNQSRFESSVRQPLQLAYYTDRNIVRQHFDVLEHEGMSTLVWRDTQMEVILEVCGIIGLASLPPVVEGKGFALRPQPENTIQRVRVIGPGDGYFNKALEAIKTIHQVHSELLTEGSLKQWEPTFIGPYPAIDAGTRIITLDENQELTRVKMPPGIDPNNILQNLEASGRYTFCEHNEVRYLEAMRGQSQQEYTALGVNPSTFRLGQIAQIQVSFRTTMPRKHGRSMFLALDTLLLLDRVGTELMAQYNARGAQHVKALQAQKNLKKRRGYEDNSIVASESPLKKKRELVNNDGSDNDATTIM